MGSSTPPTICSVNKICRLSCYHHVLWQLTEGANMVKETIGFHWGAIVTCTLLWLRVPLREVLNWCASSAVKEEPYTYGWKAPIIFISWRRFPSITSRQKWGDGRDEMEVNWRMERKNDEQRRKTNGRLEGRTNEVWRTKDGRKEGRTKRKYKRQNNEEETELISIFNLTD